MKWQTLTVLALAMLIGSIVFYQQLAQAVTILALILAGTLAIGAGIGLCFAVWLAIEKMRVIRAGRIEAEKQAHVMTLTANNQVWVRDTNHKATWHALHLEQRVYSNGQYRPPSPIEAQAWHVVNTPRKQPTGPAKHVLPPPTAAPIELLTALDSVQRCLIVGASDTGKTTLLQWIIYRRLHTSMVIVVDPHAWPDKWQGNAYVIGMGRNYDEIGKALAALVQIMTKRYDEIGKGLIGEGRHKPLAIIIDEWRAITYNVATASEAIKALLTESRKAAFSVFLATHSDRAKPLGLEGEYDLKDGFAIVRLTIANGQRQAKLDTGSGEQPATLPGIFVPATLQTAPPDFELDLEPKPTDQEQQVLTLHRQGESLSSIARQVYGNKGGKQVYRIKQILGHYG